MDVQQDISSVPTERLEADLVTWIAQLSAGMARWLEVLAEYDRRRGWESAGCLSCAQWLSWQCGLGARAARERLRVAHRLTELPVLRAAMATGELSFSRVRAITRVAVPATDELWVDLARASTATQLERAVQGVRRAERAAEPAVALAQRSVRWWWDDDGCLLVKARLPAAAGRALIASLDAAAAALPEPEPGVDDRIEARRADALVALAEGTAGAGVEVVLHTTPAGLRGGEVHADAATHDHHVHPELERLQREVGSAGHASGAAIDGVVVAGILRGGPAVAHEVAQRLACDATMRVVDAEGRWGRGTRLVRGRLRRRLLARDGGCRWPGCDARSHLRAHHIRHWAEGGATRLENLVVLCDGHHRLVHDGRWSLSLDPSGAVEVRRPAGAPLARITTTGPAGPPDGAKAPPACRWDGSPLRLHDVVEGVLLTAGAAGAG